MANLQETIQKLKNCPECVKRKEEALKKLFPHMIKKENKDELE